MPADAEQRHPIYQALIVQPELIPQPKNDINEEDWPDLEDSDEVDEDSRP